MLDLLNPRGMWRYVNEPTEPMRQQDRGTSDLDPITGCKSVSPRQAS